MPAVAIGQSINILTGQALPSTIFKDLKKTLKDSGKKLTTHSTNSLTAKIITSAEKLHEEISSQFGASATAYDVNGSLKGSYAHQIDASDYDKYYVITFSRETHVHGLPHDVDYIVKPEVLTLLGQASKEEKTDKAPKSQEMLDVEKITEFVGKYGTHLVDSVTYGQVITFVLEIRESQKSNKTQKSVKGQMKLPQGVIKSEAELAKGLEEIHNDNFVDMYFFIKGSQGNPYETLADQVQWIRHLVSNIRATEALPLEPKKKEDKEEDETAKLKVSMAAQEKEVDKLKLSLAASQAAQAQKKTKPSDSKEEKDDDAAPEPSKSIFEVMKDRECSALDNSKEGGELPEVGNLTQLSYTTLPFETWIKDRMFSMMYENIRVSNAILDNIKKADTLIRSHRDTIKYALDHMESLASITYREQGIINTDKELGQSQLRLAKAREYFVKYWYLLFNPQARLGNLNPDLYINDINEVIDYVNALDSNPGSNMNSNSKLIIFNPPMFLVGEVACNYSAGYQQPGNKGGRYSQYFPLKKLPSKIDKLHVRFHNKDNVTREKFEMVTAPEDASFRPEPRKLYLQRPRIELTYSLRTQDQQYDTKILSEEVLREGLGDYFDEFVGMYLSTPSRMQEVETFRAEIVAMVKQANALYNDPSYFILSLVPDAAPGVIYLHPPRFDLRYTVLNRNQHKVEDCITEEELWGILKDKRYQDFLAKYKAFRGPGFDINTLELYFKTILGVVVERKHIEKDAISIDFYTQWNWQSFKNYIWSSKTATLYSKVTDGSYLDTLDFLNVGRGHLYVGKIKINGVSIKDPSVAKSFKVLIYARPANFPFKDRLERCDENLLMNSPAYLVAGPSSTSSPQPTSTESKASSSALPRESLGTGSLGFFTASARNAVMGSPFGSFRNRLGNGNSSTTGLGTFVQRNIASFLPTNGYSSVPQSPRSLAPQEAGQKQEKSHSQSTIREESRSHSGSRRLSLYQEHPEPKEPQEEKQSGSQTPNQTSASETPTP